MKNLLQALKEKISNSRKKTLLLCGVLLLIGLIFNKIYNINTINYINKNIIDIPLDPPMIPIYLQPYKGISNKEIQTLIEDLNKIPEFSYTYDLVLLPTKTLSEDLKNSTKTRYSAPKIINQSKSDSIIIYITNKDISWNKPGVGDYGIQGLAFIGKNKAVISTYRLKNKEHLWKLFYHEFGHAHYGLYHCASDNPTCIMCNAYGKPNWSIKHRICESCKKKIKC